jgi:hypothetical protein
MILSLQLFDHETKINQQASFIDMKAIKSIVKEVGK